MARISLNMIVKDESHIIKKTLQNILDKVKIDYWVICDTGSSDNTINIIKEVFKEKNIPGELYEDDWKDFSHNRNLALNRVYNKSDYVLIFDADDEIHGNLILPKDMNKDMYNVKFGGGFVYTRGAILNNRIKWKYIGVLHETIICTKSSMTTANIDGDYYFISGRSGNRSKNVNKYLDDAIILENAFSTETIDWLKIRYSFYCAQSYKDAKMYDKSIEWYKKRIKLGGWNQEQYYSCLMIGQILVNLKKFEEGMFYLINTNSYDNTRYEGLYYAIDYCWNNDYRDLAVKLLNFVNNIEYDVPLVDKLFSDELIHKFRFYFLGTMVLGNTKNFQQLGCQYQKMLMKNYKYIPDTYLMSVILNIQFFIIDEEYINFSTNFINNMINEKKNLLDMHKVTEITEILQNKKNNFILQESYKYDDKDVLMTITSGKRLDLFIKTIDSIKKYILDLELVDDIICIDELSSDEDRKQMKTLYPWIKFIMKNESNKGHLISMNLIHDILKNKKNIKYWFHMEDDWEFIVEDNYITRGKYYLKKYKDIGLRQVLFNKGYSEILQDSWWKMGEKLEEGFLLHIFNEPNTPCGYWPHYSFRPSIILKETIMELGNYDSSETFFERDYANKYYNKGYRSGYFDRISCIHNGKLAGLRGQKDVKNAYELNDIEQGVNRSYNNTENIIEAKEQVNEEIKEQVNEELTGICINLDKRYDRLRQQINSCPLKFHKISAVDGNNVACLDEDEEIILNNLNDKKHIPGETGCKMSHFRLWKQIKKPTLIFEDDIIYSENAKEIFDNIKIPSDCDMLFVCGTWSKNYGLNVENRFECHNLTLEKLNQYYYKVNEHDGLYKRKHGTIEKGVNHFNTPIFRCTGGYIVTKQGGDKLRNLALKDKSFINKPIDLWFVEIGNNNSITMYEYFPHPASQIWDPIGGDINRNENKLFKLKKNNCKFPIMCINLKDRTDRLENLKKNCPFNFERFDAIDGNNLSSNSSELEYEFLKKFNGKQFVKGELGIKLSNFKIWNNIKKNTIILEDDVEFYDKSKYLINNISVPHDCDIMYIGGMWSIGYDVGTKNSWCNHDLTQERLDNCFEKNICKNIYKRKTNKLNNQHPFNTHLFRCLGSYIVTERGAANLIKLALEDDTFITLELDNWIILKGNEGKLNIHETFPHPVRNIWSPNNTDIVRSNKEIFDINKLTNKKYSVKFLGPQNWWSSSKAIMDEYAVTCEDNNCWKDIRLTCEKEADYYVIINLPSINDYYEPKKTIVCQMEPYMNTENYWKEWSKPDKNEFLHVNDHENNLNMVQTQFKIPKNIDVTKKLDIVSSIQSYKYNREGHKLRVDFLKYVNNNAPELFKVFGENNYHNLDIYSSTLNNKKDGYLNYKYYLMAESVSYNNYASEKIWEPILCECLCFYWGCPNLENYINEKSFVRLDLTKPEESLNIIKKAIQENWWEKRYDYIIEAKNKIINELGMLNVINDLINNDNK